MKRLAGRCIALILSTILTVQPLLASSYSSGSGGAPAFTVAGAALSGSSVDSGLGGLYQRYLRGEVSLSEFEDGRRGFSKAIAGEARVLSPVSASPLPEELSASAQGAGTDEVDRLFAGDDKLQSRGPGTTAGKIVKWIKEFPRRMVRRTVKARDFADPDEIMRYEESAPVPCYKGNAAQREADSDIWRPIRVTAYGELSTMQGVVERLISYNALKTLTGAARGNALSQRMVDRAGKVLSGLSAAQRAELARNFSNAGFGRRIAEAIGKNRTILSKVVHDKSGQNMVLTAVTTALVSIFMNDGLDLDQLRDHLVSLNAVSSLRTLPQLLLGNPIAAVSYYHMNNGVSLLFNKLYSKAAASGLTAGVIGKAEQSVAAFGSGIVRKLSPQQAAQAARMGRAAQGLGLPGISSGETLAFRSLAENAFKGLGFGMLIKYVLDAGWYGIVGLPDGMYVSGRRHRVFARYDLAHVYFQRTGNRFRDAIEERKTALMNHTDVFRKFPITKFLEGFAMFMGGYLGSVLAGCFIAPTGIMGFGASLLLSAVVASAGMAFGRWMGSKLDMGKKAMSRWRGKNEKRLRKYARRIDFAPAVRPQLEQALRRFDRVRSRLGIRRKADFFAIKRRGGADWRRLQRAARAYHEARFSYRDAVDRVISARAAECQKLIRAAQFNHYIVFVSSLDRIKLVKEGDYIKIIVDKQDGEAFKANASPRYDFITSDGRRGVWDYESNRIIDCGKMSENNALRIMFLGDDQVTVNSDGVIVNDDNKPIRVTKAGIVFQKAATGDWMVKGYGGEYDIVLRDSGRRFAWDGGKYVLVRPGDVKAKNTATEKQALVDKAAAAAKDREAARAAANQAALLEKRRAYLQSDKQVYDALKDLASFGKSTSGTTAERIVALALAR